MTATELRKRNLEVLLHGKGAKSALARLIQMSPASITSMVNGTRAIDKEFGNAICHAVKLPENWFETERKLGDVPDSVAKKLAPLPRGSQAPTPAAKKGPAVSHPAAKAHSDAKAHADAADEGHAPSEDRTHATAAKKTTRAAKEHAPATDTGHAAAMPQTWPSESGSKVSRVRRLTGAGIAASPAAAEASETDSPHAEAPAFAPTPGAEPQGAGATKRERAAPAATATPSRALPPSQAGDTLPGVVTGFVIEGGLSPITEALIKTLAQKARQGTLSEDRAFEMLGTVRAL